MGLQQKQAIAEMLHANDAAGHGRYHDHTTETLVVGGKKRHYGRLIMMMSLLIIFCSARCAWHECRGETR